MCWRRKSVKKLQELMHVSEALARQNVERFKSFNSSASLASAKPALLAFKGDVYRGLQAEELSPQELALSQNRIRILSGLYGVLRPLDLIQPYRLEMGTSLKVGRHKDLYSIWGNRLTNLLAEDVRQTGVSCLINAASQEYISSLERDHLGAPVIDIDFKEERNGKLTFITYNAKLARGRLARLVVEHNLQSIESLRDFDINGYQYDANRSEAGTMAFTKRG